MVLGKIRKRDGRIVDFDAERIENAVHKAFLAVELGDGGKAEKITKNVVKLLEEKFKERMPSVEDAQDAVITVLRDHGYEKVALAYEDFRKKKEELRVLRSLLGIEPKLSVNAMEVLKARYLLRDEKENIIETPTNLFERVAKAIAKVDTIYGEDAAQTEKIFYQMMAKLEFLPNTPTLFNAGTPSGQLSACFVLPIEDSLESIFTALKNMAFIEKTGGGVGFDFSKLRPRGDIVKSTKGVASGPVSFMRIFDTATEVIKAGGKRRGAMMAILRVDHPDIIEFITAKQIPNFLSNFNISVAVTDEFLNAVEADTLYWLINPRNKEKVKQVKAKEVWDRISQSAWASGDPGVVFIDEINRHNPTPHMGRIESTNPCVTSDTWVMTKDGPRTVRDLCGKSFVAIVNGQAWNGSKEGFFSTGVKPVFRLKCKEGFELRLTENHPILKVSELKRNKIKTEWTHAGTLKPDDKVQLNIHKHFDTWTGGYTEAEGYLISFLLGDGILNEDKVILSSWGDDDGAKAMRNLAYSYAKGLPHKSGFYGWKKVRGKNEYRLSVGYLKKLAQDLGLQTGSKVFTEGLEIASSEFCRGLLRGLFDTGGFIRGSQSKGVSVRLIQNKIETLKASQRILLRFGIFSKIYTNRRKEGFSLMPHCEGGKKEYLHEPQPELIISGENLLRFQEKIGFGDLVKATKLEKVINAYKRKPNRERFIATVVELISEGEDEVFNVLIPGINMFDANGFCVHNCGEQPLLSYESCNLGSINLSKMIENGVINWAKLQSTVRNAVHFLDNVVDANIFPLEETAKITLSNRKIGLGVMGYADMLIMLGIPYNSEAALKIAEQLMSFIEIEAHKKSQEIGAKRGSFPNFKGSIWEQKYPAFRNATVTTVAPTGTISIIAGCSSGIEPIFAVSFMRNVLGGSRLFETNPLFEETAKSRGFYSVRLLEETAKTGSVQNVKSVPENVKQVFVTALDIAPVWHVKMQAAFQKNIDNAISKTVNLPNEATVEDVRSIYELAWKLKCKGVTVYRYGSKPEQVLYVGEIKAKDGKFVSAESEYAGGCPTQNCPFPA